MYLHRVGRAGRFGTKASIREDAGACLKAKPEGPTYPNSINIPWPLSTSTGITFRPKYILLGYMDPYGDVRCKKFQGIQSKGHLVLKLLTYFQPRGYLYIVNYGVHCYGFGGRSA